MADVVVPVGGGSLAESASPSWLSRRSASSWVQAEAYRFGETVRPGAEVDTFPRQALAGSCSASAGSGAEVEGSDAARVVSRSAGGAMSPWIRKYIERRPWRCRRPHSRCR